MRYVTLTILSGLLAACVFFGCSKSGSPYDRLCRIYERVGDKPMTSELAMETFMKAQKEIPEISEDLWGALANSGLKEWYRILRTVARDEANQPNWQCEVFRKWSLPSPPNSQPK